jgi:hypothetical protein
MNKERRNRKTKKTLGGGYKAGNVRITLRAVRVTIVAVESKKY